MNGSGFLQAQANNLYEPIQLSNGQSPSIRPETNLVRQQWKKESGQFSGER